MAGFGQGSFGTGEYGSASSSGVLTYADEVLLDTPLAYYRLGEPSGATDMLDSSGNGHDGTYFGEPTLEVASLLVSDSADKAAFFDGVNDRAAVPAAPWMSPEHITVEFLMKLEVTYGQRAVVNRSEYDVNVGPAWSWFFHQAGDRVKFVVFTNFGMTSDAWTPVLTQGVTYHVVGTFDGETARLYLDGAEVASQSRVGILNPASSTDLNFAAEHNGNINERFIGVLDEVAIYHHALSADRIAAHYDAAITTPAPDPHVLDVGAVQVSDLLGEFTLPTGPVPHAYEPAEVQVSGLLGAFVIVGPSALPLEVAEVQASGLLGSFPAREQTYVHIGKAIEADEPQPIIPAVQTVVRIFQAVESDRARGVLALSRPPAPVTAGGVTTVRIGQAVERDTARPFILDVPSLSYTAHTLIARWANPSGYPQVTTELLLDVFDKQLEQAPTSLLVSVSNAVPLKYVDFLIDGHLVYREQPSEDGVIQLVSIPVDAEYGRRGEHLLTAVQSTNSASEVFTLRFDPNILPNTDQVPDTEPVEIPESIHPSGVRRWVLQDMLPGGLGSWVMPLNPSEMDNPTFERQLTTAHTTAVNGRLHVMEGGVQPQEWSFKGYCPTQEQAEKLRAFADLRRRFYIWDHRGRCWIVAVTSAEIVPRLRQNTIYGDLSDWVHDYTINAVIYDRVEV